MGSSSVCAAVAIVLVYIMIRPLFSNPNLRSCEQRQLCCEMQRRNDQCPLIGVVAGEIAGEEAWSCPDVST